MKAFVRLATTIFTRFSMAFILFAGLFALPHPTLPSATAFASTLPTGHPAKNLILFQGNRGRKGSPPAKPNKVIRSKKNLAIESNSKGHNFTKTGTAHTRPLADIGGGRQIGLGTVTIRSKPEPIKPIRSSTEKPPGHEVLVISTTSKAIPEKRFRSDFKDFEKVIISLDGKPIEGYKDPRTKDVYVKTEQFPEKLQKNHAQLRSLVDGASIPSPAALRQQLLVGLKESDRQAAKGQYAQANRHVNRLIEKHGAKPELLLRRGLIQLSSSVPQAGVVIRQTAKETGLRNQKKFFNEVNNRLAANSSLPVGESVSLVKAAGRVELHYRMNKPPGGSNVKPGEIKEARALFYLQDDPSLNNLDWKVPIRQSLPTVVANNQAMVIRLSSEGIARYRPAKITVPGGGQYRLVESLKIRNTVGGNNQKGGGAMPGAKGFGDSDCTPEQESRGLCRREQAIYLILTKRDQ